MDAVAAAGVVGRANHVPASLPAGSDVANLSLLGYNPHELFHRPGAAGSRRAGHRAGPERLGRSAAIWSRSKTRRCATSRPTTSRPRRPPSCWPRCKSSCGGDAAASSCPGVSYRNLLIYRGGDRPAAVHGRHASHAAARPDRQVGARRLSARAGQRLAESTDERQRGAFRRSSGERGAPRSKVELPATNIWLWGLGRTPAAAAVRGSLRQDGGDDHGGRSAARAGGADRLAADRSARRHRLSRHRLRRQRARCAIEALAETDLVCVHVEATDEASHEGNAAAKIKALEEIDRHIVGPLHEALEGAGRLPHSGLARSSHAAAHENAQPRRRAVRDRRQRASRPTNSTYDEVNAERSTLAFDEGWRLMRYFLRHVACTIVGTSHQRRCRCADCQPLR